MEFTLSQFRGLVGISLETHRHWRRVLPPIARKGGRAPCFTVGDLIAGLVVRRLTEDVGVRVGCMVHMADELFHLCRSPWATLEGSILSFDLCRGTCTLSKGRSPSSMADLTLMCRLDPILETVRGSLLTDQSLDQASLPSGPLSLRAEPPRRRA